MRGTCIGCGGKNMDINPYEDSRFYRMCFICQMKALDKEKEEANK